MNAIIEKVQQAIAKSNWGIAPTRDDVAQRAIEIIELLATKESFPLRALQAELRCSLLMATGDAALATNIEHQLIGALLADASAGPESARWYDINWFRQVTGFDPTSQKPFDLSARHACNSQVESQTPISYRESLFAARTEVHEVLTEFLSSPKTCFLVTGRSGTGKTWSLFHWARHILKDRARLFLDGQRHQIGQTLPSMLAIELRPLTSQTSVSDEALSEKIVTASQSPDFGPLVLIVDDIQPTSDQIETFRGNLNRLVLDCKARGIKLVVSCQTERVSGLDPFSQIRPDLLFHPGETTQRVDRVRHRKPFELTEFVDNELDDAISRRLSDEPSQRNSLRLKAPVFHYVRNPYILDLLFRSGREVVVLHSTVEAEECVDELFQQRIWDLVERVSIDCALDEISAQEAFDAMLQSLWSQRHRTVRRPDVQRHINEVVPGSGERVVDVMVRRGVIALGQSLAFAEPQLAARAIALWLHRHKSVETVISELTLDTDTEVLTEWLRLQVFPARIAKSIVSQSDKWPPAVAHALSRCRIDDLNVVASFVGLARDHSDYSVDWRVCDAFGEYAMRSRVTWKWIVRLFLSHDDGDRTIGERALYSIAPYVPDRVAHAVRHRIARDRLRLKSSKEPERRTRFARAIRAQRNIDSKFAGQIVLKELARVTDLVEPTCSGNAETDALQKVLVDPFLTEFDELHAVAAYHADPSLFTHICDGLQSDDNVQRLRSTNGIAALGRDASRVVGPMLAEAILNEHVAPIAARMIWHLVGFAETDPITAFHAVSNCPANRWDDYELSGTALSLFEWIGRKFPKVPALTPIFPRVLLPQNDEGRFWLSDTFLVALQPFLISDPDTARCRADLVESFSIDDRQEPVFVMLRHRAIAVARLLEIVGPTGKSDTPDIHRVELRGGWGCFFLLNWESWIREHVSEVIEDSELHCVVEELLKSIAASENFKPDHFDKWRKNAAFMTTRDSIGVLVACLSRFSEPV
ncbi:MAG: hypothetical protein IAG10_30805, partial [Planctomycetaceae bacterium]|nr:hypothetical protein [Planctomycetaceae bacterium]